MVYLNKPISEENEERSQRCPCCNRDIANKDSGVCYTCEKMIEEVKKRK